MPVTCFQELGILHLWAMGVCERILAYTRPKIEKYKINFTRIKRPL